MNREDLLTIFLLGEAQSAKSAWHLFEPEILASDLLLDEWPLVSLIAPRLRELGLKCSLYARLKGAQKKIWYQNQVAMQVLSGLSDTLTAAGIRHTVSGDPLLYNSNCEVARYKLVKKATLYIGAEQSLETVPAMAASAGFTSCSSPQLELRSPQAGWMRVTVKIDTFNGADRQQAFGPVPAWVAVNDILGEKAGREDVAGAVLLLKTAGLPVDAASVSEKIVAGSSREKLKHTLDILSGKIPVRQRAVHQEAKCVICGWSGLSFRDWYDHYGRKKESSVCPQCESHPRHRSIYLYLSRRVHLKPGQAILHFAPEPCLAGLLQNMPGVRYLSADIRTGQALDRQDITQLTYDPDSFDLIICSHVLEHVEEHQKALFEIRRVLKPEGFAIIDVPIDFQSHTATERPSYMSPWEAEEKFWNEDHKRLYGKNFGSFLEKTGFHVLCERPHRYVKDRDITTFGLNPFPLFICRKTACSWFQTAGYLGRSVYWLFSSPAHLKRVLMDSLPPLVACRLRLLRKSAAAVFSRRDKRC